MANKRPIGDHSDKKFLNRFNRYYIANLVVESKSWNDLTVKIKAGNYETNYQNLLYQEFRFYNCILIIEYRLCDLLEKLNSSKNLKKIKGYLIKKLKRYRAMDKKNAEIVLNAQVENNDSNLLTPNILFYICGLWLGDLIYLTREMTDDFTDKENFLEKLQKLNNYRTDIVHNLLSSRIDIEEQINRGIELTIELKELIENFT